MQSFPQDNNSISAQEATPQIDSSQTSLGKSLLSPFVARSLTCSDYGSFCYNQRHNLIVDASEQSIEFYDATTLKKIKTQDLEDWVACISYCDQIDTYIIACDSGFFYSYNASKDELKELQKCEGNVPRIEVLDSKFYAFLLIGSKRIYIGNLENKNVISFGWNNLKPNGLLHMAKYSLLLSSFDNGSVKIFNTNKLPHLQVLLSVQTHQNKMIHALQSFCLNGKEYVITSGKDMTLRIWHLVKGRMRLLKVVRTDGKTADSVVYLENYNMVAASYEENRIDFFKLPTWRLEKTFCCEFDAKELFMMKDKDMIGFLSDMGVFGNSIEFVQLHPKEK